MKRTYSITYYLGAFMLKAEIRAKNPKEAQRIAKGMGIYPIRISAL